MTTACPTSDILKSFADSLLDDAETERIEKHLLGCEPCRMEVERLEREPGEPLQQRLRKVARLDEPGDGPTEEEIPDHIGQYKTLGRLGSGGMGTVYGAVHPHLKREVAVKVVKESRALDPAAKERFQREVLAAGKLHHPNIVQTFDASFEDGRPFLVMELLHGVDLGEYVQRHGKLRPEVACDYVRQTALGLQHAHEAGIVHRDIKPSNLFLTDDGTVKVLDLGLAMLRDDAENPASFWEKDASASKTATGHILGSPDFLSPEQALALKVDNRSDIYSLGCTLYFLLHGDAPFSGEKYDMLPDKLAGHVRDDLPKLPISQRLDGLLRKMVAKSPENRPAAAEIAAALAPRRHTLRNTVLAVLFVAVVCAATYMVASRDDGAEPFFNRGVALMADQHNEEALQELSEAIRRRPTFVEAYNKRAEAHLLLGDKKSSADDYAEVIRLFPENNSAYIGRGAYLRDSGNLQKALDDFDHAIRQNPNDAQAFLGRCETLRLLKRLDEALADGDNAVRLEPDNPYAFNNRGLVYMELGRFDEAITDFNEAVRLDPGIPRPYGNRGLAFGEMGDFEKALADMDKLIEMRPNLAIALNNRGNVKIKIGDNEGAIADLDKAIALDPDLALAYNNRGLAKVGLGRCEDAIPDFDKAIALNPSLVMAYNNRGFVQSDLGRYDDAIRDLDKAIEFDPNLFHAYYNRACQARSRKICRSYQRFRQGRHAGPTICLMLLVSRCRLFRTRTGRKRHRRCHAIS